MSRYIKLDQIQAVDDLSDCSSDDLRLQIDVRLRVDDSAGRDPSPGDPPRWPTSKELQQLAGSIYDARRKRDKMLAQECFGEPAWDMLLALYCFPGRGENLSVTALSYAANVPPSTGHRTQAALVARGLIDRVPESSDGRRQIVSLTKEGRRILEAYFISLLRSDRRLPTCLGVAGR